MYQITGKLQVKPNQAQTSYDDRAPHAPTTTATATSEVY